MSRLKLDASKWPLMSAAEILNDINIQITECLTPGDAGYGGLPDTLSASEEGIKLLKSRDCLSAEARAAMDWPIKRDPPITPLPLDNYIAKIPGMSFAQGF